eukprot:1381569-Amorphochlora_amoeboformis.AAC.1
MESPRRVSTNERATIHSELAGTLTDAGASSARVASLGKRGLLVANIGKRVQAGLKEFEYRFVVAKFDGTRGGGESNAVTVQRTSAFSA